MDDLGSVGHLRKIKYQDIEVDITTTAQNYNLSFQLDRLYKRVKGVAMQIVPLTGTPNTDFLKFKKFEIQNREIYPTNFYAKHLDTSNDVPLNNKFDKDIDEPAQGAQVDIVLKDDITAMTGDYRVILTFKLEN